VNVVGGRAGRAGTNHLLTIGQLADYAGVTVKAVRHYHARGLLEEPPRDSSGYRRYAAEHAIQLIKIKTLADAGVPLASIKELLAADSERFAAALTEIDRKLQERVAEALRTRERIARLSTGNRLFVSAEVADFLDGLHELGVSERTVRIERDMWILLQSVSPKEAEVWIADKRDAIGDPEFRAIYLEYDAAFDWSSNDQRLHGLADRTGRWIANRRAKLERREWPVPDPAIAQLMATSVGETSPAWDRLAEIARELWAGEVNNSARRSG
jgi:DNA-binding transcriptional MerR regulator